MEQAWPEIEFVDDEVFDSVYYLELEYDGPENGYYIEVDGIPSSTGGYQDNHHLQPMFSLKEETSWCDVRRCGECFTKDEAVYWDSQIEEWAGYLAEHKVEWDPTIRF